MQETWANLGIDLHLDVSGPGGRRAALERALREAIRGGQLAPGTRLPSTRSLAADLGLARGTVSAAYDQLGTEGYLASRVGSGTVVADLPRAPATASAPPADGPGWRYDLRPGAPDVGTFPATAWLRSARRALAAAPPSAYGYGDPHGRPELRAALADYLGRARGVRADPARVVVTTGYAQALALLMTALAPRAVAMEDPGLVDHRELVRRSGAAVIPMPVDGHGARTDRLSATAAALAVLTPAHQYPVGVTLHPHRRRAAVAWARRSGGYVLEDDYDGEFRYDRRPVGAVQGVAPEHVIYAGTTSKTLAPALRLGWLVLPERLVEPVVEAKRCADLHTEVLGQLTLADLVTSHAYDRHVRSCRQRYRRRRDLLLARLGSTSAARWRLAGVAAGLHTLLWLPASGPSEAQVLAAAGTHGLALGDLASQWHHPGDHPPGVLVGYGAAREGSYPAAVDTLAGVLQSASASP